jgi:hypothetical protein
MEQGLLASGVVALWNQMRDAIGQAVMEFNKESTPEESASHTDCMANGAHCVRVSRALDHRSKYSWRKNPTIFAPRFPRNNRPQIQAGEFAAHTGSIMDGPTCPIAARQRRERMRPRDVRLFGRREAIRVYRKPFSPGALIDRVRGFSMAQPLLAINPTRRARQDDATPCANVASAFSA